jgi:hypothetical protein
MIRHQPARNPVVAALLASALVAGAWLAAPAAAAAEPPNSGFLPDYTLLKPVKGPSGSKLERWVSPQFSRENYHAVLVDEIVFFPTPQPTSQVSQQTMDEIRAYLSNALSNVALASLPHATHPGPGVVRLRTAITAVATGDTALKPYELVPAAFVFSGAMRLAGQRSQDVTLSVEALASDSESGAPLAMVVRHGKGEQLKNTTTPVTLEALKPRIDEWARSAAQLVEERLGEAPR